MTFLQPLWFAAWPMAISLILLLHARRRRDVVVPSLLVWRTVNFDAAAAPSPKKVPWRDPRLWLQLLAASIFVLALAQPTVGGQRVDHVVLLVDTSSAMSARDIEPSRLGRAIETFTDGLTSAPTNTAVSVVTVGNRAAVVAAKWPVGPRLQALLHDLVAVEGRPDWVGAAQRAALLAGDWEAVRVAVLTEPAGVVAARQALTDAGLDGATVAIGTFGEALVDVGIGDVAATLRGERPDQWTVTGTVTSSGFADGDVVRIVAGYRATSEGTFLPWGGADVVLGADGGGEFTIPLDVPGPGEVELRGPLGDQLEANDSAVLLLRSEPVRVAILGPAQPALLRALAAVGDLEVYAIESLDAASAASFDLVIVTRPGEAVPATSTLWLGTVPEDIAAGDYVDVGGRPVTPGQHPLGADLDTAALGLVRARPLRLPAGARPLVSVGGATVAWARTTTSGRQVAFGFDLDDSAWASQVSFPAFMAALVEWAAPRRAAGPEATCQVGEACAWPREAFAGGWQLVDPDGEPVPVPIAPREVADDPLAEAVWDPVLLDAGFTPVRSGAYRLNLADGGVTIPVRAPPIDHEPSAPDPVAASDPWFTSSAGWRWLAGIAVALLLGEALLVLRREPAAVWRRARGHLVIAALAATAAVMALLGLALPLLQHGGAAAWVGVDASAAELRAVREASPGWSWTWVEHRRAGEVSPASRSASEPDLSVPDLATALEVALATPAPGDGPRVLVATAGQTLTAADAASLVARARAVGAAVDLVENDAGAGLADEERPRLDIEQVGLPESVRAGASFEIGVDLEADDETPWRLSAELVSNGGTRPVAGDAAGDRAPTLEPSDPAGPAILPLKPTTSAEVVGAGSAHASLELVAGEPGELVYRVTLLAGADEPVAEELVVVPVGSRLRALMVALDDSHGSVLADALAAQGIEVTRATPFRMPSSLTRLAAFDLVVLVNVPASEMFPEYQAMLESYVREEGGGLILFGGDAAFGPGGYYATPLDSLSPLSAKITDEAPEVAMAFVLDRSGSMNGAVAGATRMDVAKAATLEALSLLGEKSLAAVIVFDNAAQVVLPLTPVSDAQAFERALTTVSPAGGTAIHPGLVTAFELMSRTPSATRHVVVMTDGLSQEGDFEGVLDALRDIGVSTSFVGVGDEADRRQLSNLANLSGGALHMARDFRALPGLLAQEVMMLAADPIVEAPTTAVWSGGVPPAFLGAIVEGRPPRLDGYIKTTAKDEASVHLIETADDDPLLASWRYGLGRVVAFASEADGPWSAAWRSAPDYGRLWAQVARWVAESPVPTGWRLTVGGDEGALDIVVDVRSDAAIEATALPVVALSSEDGTALAAQRLTWHGPGRAAARFEVAGDLAGVLSVRVAAAPELGLQDDLVRSVPWPLPPATPVRHDLLTLAELSSLTGGSANDVGAAGLDRTSPTLVWRRSPTAWLALAMCGFLLSLAVRYGGWSALVQCLSRGRRARTRTASRGRSPRVVDRTPAG